MAGLEGKVAVITGAGRGIGRAIALAMARQGVSLGLIDSGCARDGSGADAQVVSALAAELSALGAKVAISSHSVTNESSMIETFERFRDELGPLDVLVNSAGILRDRGLFEHSVTDFSEVVETSLLGTFLCGREASKQFRESRRGGTIINMTGLAGLQGNVGQINEAAAKAGVFGLTRTQSIELQRYRVTANAIAPIARTRLTEDLPMFEKVRGSMEPEHIAPMALFLASEDARSVSGMVFAVAGGRISALRLTETEGRLKEEDGGIWTPEEIRDHLGAIVRI